MTDQGYYTQEAEATDDDLSLTGATSDRDKDYSADDRKPPAKRQISHPPRTPDRPTAPRRSAQQRTPHASNTAAAAFRQRQQQTPFGTKTRQQDTPEFSSTIKPLDYLVYECGLNLPDVFAR